MLNLAFTVRLGGLVADVATVHMVRETLTG